MINHKYSIDLFDEVLCDISDFDFSYNYKIPQKINNLTNISEFSLILNSKFSNFTLSNNFKYSKLTKRVITINGDSVFDLFIKNDDDKFDKKDNILNLNFTNKHYNFKDDENNNINIIKKGLITTKNNKPKKKIILKTTLDNQIIDSTLNANLTNTNNELNNSENLFSNKNNKLSIYENLKVIKPKYRLTI